MVWSVSLASSQWHWHRWSIICQCPSWLIFFKPSLFLSPLLSSVRFLLSLPWSDGGPRSSAGGMCVYLVVFIWQFIPPFPVGAAFHLWMRQPVTAGRSLSALWFRNLALPSKPSSCEFVTHSFTTPNPQPLCNPFPPPPHPPLVWHAKCFHCVSFRPFEKRRARGREEGN